MVGLGGVNAGCSFTNLSTEWHKEGSSDEDGGLVAEEVD